MQYCPIYSVKSNNLINHSIFGGERGEGGNMPCGKVTNIE